MSTGSGRVADSRPAAGARNRRCPTGRGGGGVERAAGVEQHVAVAGAADRPAEAAGNVRARLAVRARRVAVFGERDRVGGRIRGADPLDRPVLATAAEHASGRSRSAGRARRYAVAGGSAAPGASPPGRRRSADEQDRVAALGRPAGGRHRVGRVGGRRDHHVCARLSPLAALAKRSIAAASV